MSAPLPDALRARFKACLEEGLSARAAAARLKLSPATGTRWARAIRQHGTAAPAPQGRPRGRGKLAPHQAFLEELIAQDPDITLYELRCAGHGRGREGSPLVNRSAAQAARFQL